MVWGFFLIVCLFLVFWDIHCSPTVWSRVLSLLCIPTGKIHTGSNWHVNANVRTSLYEECPWIYPPRHLAGRAHGAIWFTHALFIFSDSLNSSCVSVCAMLRSIGKVAVYYCIIPIRDLTKRNRSHNNNRYWSSIFTWIFNTHINPTYVSLSTLHLLLTCFLEIYNSSAAGKCFFVYTVLHYRNYRNISKKPLQIWIA